MSDVQAAAPRPIARPRPPDVATDVRLARVHLRMGLLGLARAELEALAGAGHLDDDGLVALAEARWRTGDLTGAGDAAKAHLANHDADEPSLVGLVIAAEATAALGRPGEARRLADRAIGRSGATLDDVFAGMPRSMVWPADAADAGRPAGMLFAEAGPPPPSTSVRMPSAAVDAPADVAGGQVDEPGFWDAPEPHEAAPHSALDAAAALETGAAALDDADAPRAAALLGLALRLNPGLAAPVLDLIRHAAVAAPELDIVRGDAFRLVGHDVDAQRAWATAAAALARRTRTGATHQEES